MADEQLIQKQIGKQKPIGKNANKNIVHAPIKNQEKVKEEEIEKDDETNKRDKTEEKKKGEKETEKKEKREKKTEATVNAQNIRISNKQAVAIARFIKFKKIDYAIGLLEKVIKKKIAIPFKGEMAHRKGKRLDGRGMMTGKYPVNASKEFIKLLKSLNANGNANGMDSENTIIYEVITNKAPTQYHRFGSTKFKRTHVYIKAKEIIKNKEKTGGKK